VCGIEEAVEKTDGDGVDAGVPQHAGRATHGNLIERSFNVPTIAQPFRHLEAQRPLYEHRPFVCLQIVKFGSLLSTDFQKIAEPVTRDQTGRRTSMLNERIGGHRGPVAEVGDIARVHADLGERFAEPFCDRQRRIGGGRGNLPNGDTPALLFEQADIGEGAAGIDANPPGIYPYHSVADSLPIIMGHGRKRNHCRCHAGPPRTKLKSAVRYLGIEVAMMRAIFRDIPMPPGKAKAAGLGETAIVGAPTLRATCCSL
jgi:hypothetical protein